VTVHRPMLPNIKPSVWRAARELKPFLLEADRRISAPESPAIRRQISRVTAFIKTHRLFVT
jgi:hypothetical protein